MKVGKNDLPRLLKRCWLRKKPKAYSATHEGSPAASKLLIDLTSSKGKKNKAIRFVPVMPVIPNTTSSIADKIAQRRSSAVPPMLKFMPKCPMKNGKVPLPAKVVQNPFSLLLRLIRLLRRMRLLVWAVVRNPPSLLLEKLLRFVHY
ncbi:hypothetical protein ACFXTI_041443 [Malus domestica]